MRHGISVGAAGGSGRTVPRVDRGGGGSNGG